MRLAVTVVAVALLTLAAFRRGGGPEKSAAIVFALSLAVGILLRSVRGPAGFRQFDSAQFLIEVAVLAAVLAIALRANRWWPIWVSSFQLLIVATHLAKLAEIKGLAGAYWLMTTVPTYCQYALLLGGLRNHSLRQRSLLRYSDWRTD
jgi:hypothetical protein